MKKSFSILPIFIVLLVLCMTYYDAEAGSAKRRGTSGAQELLIPVGAAGTALGGSFNAVLTGIEAAYWNPAGVADVSGTGEAMFSYMNYIADINLTYAAGMAKFGGIGAIGATLKTVDFGDIPITTTDAPDGTGEYYSPQYFNLGILFSRVMTDRIRFGVSLNLVSEQIMRMSATGVALDAGVQYSTGPGGFRLGVALKNLGTDMLFTGPDAEAQVVPPGTEPGTRQEPWRVPLATFELPTQMELGLAYSPINQNGMRLTVASSFLNDNFSYDQYRFGAELALMDMLFLRGSYMMAQDPESGGFESMTENFFWGPGIGAGLKIHFGPTSYIFLDWALRKTEYFSNNQWFSIRFGF